MSTPAVEPKLTDHVWHLQNWDIQDSFRVVR